MLILTTILSSCSRLPTQVDYTPVPIDRPELILPDTDTLDMKSVDFIIVTLDNAEAVFKKLEAEGQPVVIFGMDSQNYENNAVNFSNIIKLLSQQKSVILAYENYYNTDDKTDPPID